MTRHVLPATALAVAMLVPHFSVSAAKPGNVVDLGHLGGGFSEALGINNDLSSVQVVGHSTRADGFTHAFFWTAPGPMVDLATFGRSSSAWDINNHGQVAGSSEDAARQQWAAVWTLSGSTWTIENLGTATGTCCAHAFGINNGTAGASAAVAIVGSSTVNSGARHAAVWTMSAGGWAVQTLGTLPDDTFSVAHDVNDDGIVVGLSGRGTGEVASGFLWTAATGMSLLPGLGGELTNALAIGSSGDVAGLSTDAGGTSHAVRWRSSAGWAVEDLGTLGGCCSSGSGINTFGDVVGWSNLGSRSGTQRAFLARPAGAMTDLGAPQGQSAARDLNDFGVVVGGASARGRVHAVVWRLP